MGACGRTVVGSEGAAVVSFAIHFRTGAVLADGVFVVGNTGCRSVAGVAAAAGDEGAGVVETFEMTAFTVAGAFVGCVALYDLAAAVHTGEMGTCGRTVVGSEGAAVVSFAIHFRTGAVLADGVFVVGNTGCRSVAGVAAA